MREIEFRAKSKDDGVWRYGVPINTHLGTFIMFEENPPYCGVYNYMEIDELELAQEETIGQFTGMLDKNGRKIYEGDIVDQYYQAWNHEEKEYFSGNHVGVVHYRPSEGFVMFPYMTQDEGDGSIFVNKNKTKRIVQYRCKVIGNIFDNPEFMIDVEFEKDLDKIVDFLRNMEE